MGLANFAIQRLGYDLTEQLYEGSRTLVYRALRKTDQTSVVIKLSRNEHPRFADLVQFCNQYTIAKNLDLPGIVKPHSLEPYHNGYALIMEDFGGISLAKYRQESTKQENYCFGISDFLAIALQLADILNGFYNCRIIHKDLKPANILINPETKQVKVIDFSIASLLPRETQEIQSLSVLEGTLAYLSPEQTGRMNRGIDYRSDFYSLGVTFYELLTGQLPFQSTDPMELVHCHIAKQPPSIHRLNPDIPLVLSEIVSKLMAKNAEDRYQSALGLKHDLRQCLSRWQEARTIECFELGRQDLGDRFVIPEKLYGRQPEIQTLLDAFERVAQSATELILVAGFSGIGKTAVVTEVHKPIARRAGMDTARQRSYFIKGKFDQFQRNIPFSAFVQAFRDLMAQLLGETDAQLEQWKSAILTALENSGQVIIDVIPELECLIGKQPAIANLSSSAAQSRFNLLFQKFIQVFTTKEHPLVVFIDDLQWADSASLKLLELLMGQAESHYLLIIGAYRDHEVFPAHPLMLSLQEIQQTGATINAIALTPLKLSDLEHLIADTLHCSFTAAQPLAQLVHRKTKGNPFFSNQFLKALHEDGLITFNADLRCWQYDIDQVQALASTEDVVEFIAAQLQKLPITTQTALKLAACIGNHFDLATLAVVLEKPRIKVVSDLWQALQDGLILPVDTAYKAIQIEQLPDQKETQTLSIAYRFLHDRVQQAAYSLIPKAEQQQVHLTIGRLLLKKASSEQPQEMLFDIVHHLNMGTDLIKHQTERYALAQLNLQAAQKAKASTAYEAALDYLTAGSKLLEPDSWQINYELTFVLYLELVEAAYLCGQYEQADSLSNLLLAHARNKLDQARVYNLKVILYRHLNRVDRVIEAGYQALKLFDRNLPITKQQIKLAASQTFNQLQQNLAGQQIENLIHLPDIIDPEKLVIMEVLKDLIIPASHANEDLFRLLILEMMQLSLQYGNSVAGASAYSWYGIILGSRLGDFETGYQYGKLALKLAEKYSDAQLQCKVNFIFGTYIAPWKRHLRTNQKYLTRAYEYGLESGDLFWAGYAVFFIIIRMLSRGDPLQEVEQAIQKYLDFMQKKSDQGTILNFLFVRQMLLNLQGLTDSRYSFSQGAFDEAAAIEELKQISPPDLHHCYCYRLYVYYLLGDYSAALAVAEVAGQEIRAVLVGDLPVAEHCFYYALTLTALYPDMPPLQQQQYWQLLLKHRRQMKRWAAHCRENFLHKYLLVSAEMARISGKNYQAMELYDRAIASAREEDFIQNEAIGNELAAKFYLHQGQERIARVYLIEAYYGYIRWGASAKVDDLEQRYEQLLAPVLQQSQTRLVSNETVVLGSPTTSHLGRGKSTSSDGAALTELDLATILKASQALSSEIHLDQLLSTLLQVVIENAGADKCVLLLVEAGKLGIEAIATAEQPLLRLRSRSLEDSQDLPVTLINSVKRTLQPSVMIDATTHPLLLSDPYVIREQPKSLLCTPILHQGKLLGVLYLENNLATGAFTRDRLEMLNILCSQAAISLENARLYQESQRLYQQSQDYAQQLGRSLQEMQQMQLQLIQSEKMSALGNLVAGIAHEINNPIGFISGNLAPARNSIQDLLELIDLYQQKLPDPDSEIAAKIKAIDLDYLREDLPKLIRSMKLGVDRISSISTSLRTFSRADREYKVPFNLHEGIDSTLLILKHRLKANDARPAIEVVTDYGELPLVECFAGQLNQVFMNLLANAIDALEAFNQKRRIEEIEAAPNCITIQTRLTETGEQVIIRIADNGMGMTETVKQQVFDHLFTTKPVGQGTGLGLAIARQIVVEKHHGAIEVNSSPGQGAEFVILLPVKLTGEISE